MLGWAGPSDTPGGGPCLPSEAGSRQGPGQPGGSYQPASLPGKPVSTTRRVRSSGGCFPSSHSCDDLGAVQMTPERRGCREPATRPAAPQLGRAVGAAHHRWKVLLGHKGPGIQGSRLHSPLSPAIRTAHSQTRGVPPPGKSCLESTRSPAVRYERRQVQARAEPSSRPIVGTRARRPPSAPRDPLRPRTPARTGPPTKPRLPPNSTFG